MRRSKKKAFLLYNDWMPLFEILPSDEERGKLIMALFAFASDKHPADGLSDMANMAFMCMAAQIRRDSEEWEATCKARREAGKKGGAPKGNQNARKNKQSEATETQDQPKQAKQPDTDTDTETDTDTVTESESVTDTGASPVSPAAMKTPAPTHNEYKTRYGFEGIILLSESEHEALCREYGADNVKDMIDRMSDYCLAKGVEYQDYAAALRRWFRDERSKSAYRNAPAKEHSYDLNEWEKYAEELDMETLIAMQRAQ